jgi:GYF domain 2
VSNTIDAVGATSDEWFFTENGQRRGPVTTAALLELLCAEKISGDTLVWRKGFADWQSLRTTDLGRHLQDSPPPVAPTHVNNSLVWTLAIAPIGYAILAGWRDTEIMENPYGDHSLAQFVTLAVPVILNAALCLLDERQLKRAGYADKWLTLFGILLAPVYLFYVQNGCGSFRAMGSCGSPALSFRS